MKTFLLFSWKKRTVYANTRSWRWWQIWYVNRKTDKCMEKMKNCHACNGLCPYIDNIFSAIVLLGRKNVLARIPQQFSMVSPTNSSRSRLIKYVRKNGWAFALSLKCKYAWRTSKICRWKYRRREERGTRHDTAQWQQKREQTKVFLLCHFII